MNSAGVKKKIKFLTCPSTQIHVEKKLRTNIHTTELIFSRSSFISKSARKKGFYSLIGVRWQIVFKKKKSHLMLARHISALNKYKVSSQILVQKLSRLSSTGARVPRAFPNSGESRDAPRGTPDRHAYRAIAPSAVGETPDSPRHCAWIPVYPRRSSNPLSPWTRELHVFPAPLRSVFPNSPLRSCALSTTKLDSA